MYGITSTAGLNFLYHRIIWLYSDPLPGLLAVNCTFKTLPRAKHAGIKPGNFPSTNSLTGGVEGIMVDWTLHNELNR